MRLWKKSMNEACTNMLDAHGVAGASSFGASNVLAIRNNAKGYLLSVTIEHSVSQRSIRRGSRSKHDIYTG